MSRGVPWRRLAVLALVPALLSGCSAIPGLSSAADGGSSAGSGAEGTGRSWIVAAQGSPAASARPGYGAASPTPGPSGFLPLRAPTPTGTPTSTCSPNTLDLSRIASLDVTPSATSAVLTWYNMGGDDLVEFRLYAISQNLVAGRQRDVGFVTVQPGTACGRMSATIGNLDRKTRYVFSVDAVVLRRSSDGTHAATVARSQPVITG